MNFNKGYNEFCDIPGFDASKGERIVKALQRLWKKIGELEQIRSEREAGAKEIQKTSGDEDLTITDVQYQLLILQLRYVRSILRKRTDSCSEILEGVQTSHVHDINDPKNSQFHEDFHRKTISHETQAINSLSKEVNPCMNSSMPRNAKKINTQVCADGQEFRSEELTDNSALSIAPQSSSKPHYHLKLDDVPFILGASSTASHSVVANVQNIIAMMKSHNKALCGSKHHASRSAVNTHSAAGNSQDATKMLNELTQDLNELVLKHEKLAKRFDAALGNNQISNYTKGFEMEDKRKINKSVSMKNHANNTIRRCRSNSDSSIKLHPKVRNFSKVKERDIQYNIQQKQNLTNIRSQPSNLPIMTRRKLLRSLQNFKTYLSEEDISWD